MLVSIHEGDWLQAPHKDSDRIDIDGLPYVGSVVYPKQAYCSRQNLDTGDFPSQLDMGAARQSCG